VPFVNGGPAGYEIFASGFVGSGTATATGADHRATGLAQGPDGSLYITDDKGGRIWRVVYRGQRGPPGDPGRLPEKASKPARGDRRIREARNCKLRLQLPTLPLGIGPRSNVGGQVLGATLIDGVAACCDRPNDGIQAGPRTWPQGGHIPWPTEPLDLAKGSTES
jgi:hypothetical protein